jgi:adenylate cyclase
MKFKTKLYLALLGLTFGTTLIGLSAVYWEVQRLLFNDLRSKVLTVAATAAETIDGDQLAKIQTRADANTPAFESLVDTMRKIRRVNRRSDLYVIYIYTMRPDPAEHGQLVVGVDASDDPSTFAYPGTPYPEGVKIGILAHLNEIWAPHDLVRDRWGRFLTGYAPVYDSRGSYVGTLGVSLSAHFVFDELGRLRVLVFSTLALTLIIGFVVATLLAHSTSHSLEEINETVQHIGHGDLKARVPHTGPDEFGQLAEAINNMAKGLEEHERLKLNFVRYVSKHVMEKILATDVMPALQGERRKITVLFSDIRDFTRLAEKLPPEEVVSILNEFLDKMLNVIFERNGTLDKFLGDGLMVEFGAPLDDEKQETHAVETAIQMQRALAELNRKWESLGRPQLEMGVGIHTGQAVVGNIGSEKRLEYTAIGDTVNVASRLEHATKEIHVPILVSEATHSALSKQFKTKSLGPISLPGRETPIGVFSVEVT